MTGNFYGISTGAMIAGGDSPTGKSCLITAHAHSSHSLFDEVVALPS
ncbi:MAG: hypothetical protein ACE1ZG_03895 [Gammaproteobacteria bacterium]